MECYFIVSTSATDRSAAAVRKKEFRGSYDMHALYLILDSLSKLVNVRKVTDAKLKLSDAMLAVTEHSVNDQARISQVELGMY